MINKKTILTKLKPIASYLLGALLVYTGIVLAGSLTPGEGVTTSTATHYTLSDIYNKLNLNTYSVSSHSVSTSSSPLASMNTLTEIWNSIPTISASTIATGTTIMGIAGTNPAWAYGSTSASGVLYSASPGAGTANDTTTFASGHVIAPAAQIIDGYSAFGANGLVIDGTGSAGTPALEWSADNPAGYVDWATAGAYCSVTLGNGYRLPHMWELAQYYQQNGAGSFQAGYYWSSTEYPDDPDFAYGVYVSNGYVDFYGKTSPNYLARCAR